MPDFDLGPNPISNTIINEAELLKTIQMPKNLKKLVERLPKA